MATTTLNTDIMLVVILITVLTVAATFLWGLYSVVCFCVRWCWNYKKEVSARKFLSWFGNHDDEFSGSLQKVGAVDAEGKATARVGGARGWTRVRRSAITEIAFGLADEAYLQFGRRDKSKANDLVTRKFLRDQLSKFDSLRAKDKSRIIEIALSLSYVSPDTAVEMESLEGTNAYARLVSFGEPTIR